MHNGFDLVENNFCIFGNESSETVIVFMFVILGRHKLMVIIILKEIL